MKLIEMKLKVRYFSFTMKNNNYFRVKGGTKLEKPHNSVLRRYYYVENKRDKN